jgi:hypothetical protein
MTVSNTKEDGPYAERHRLAGIKYLAAHRALRMLEATKDARLAVAKNTLTAEDPKMSDAKADRLVKASPEWAAFMLELAEADCAYEHARINLAKFKTAFDEWKERNANARHEWKMGQGTP